MYVVWYTYQLSHTERKEKMRRKHRERQQKSADQWRIQTWLSFDSARHSRFLHLFACQYDFSLMRWLFAGKHFLINYTVQSTIHTIRAHSAVRTHHVDGTTLALLQLPVVARRFHLFPFFSCVCVFILVLVLNMRSIQCDNFSLSLSSFFAVRGGWLRWLELFCYRLVYWHTIFAIQCVCVMVRI